jgi:hypothetical protein
MKSENEFLIIKNEKPPKEKIKWTVESDLFYLVECKHCMIVFLVEEESEHFDNPEYPNKIPLKCPVCHTNNLIPKRKNRLKLKLDRIMKPEEENLWYTKIIEREKKKGGEKD